MFCKRGLFYPTRELIKDKRVDPCIEDNYAIHISSANGNCDIVNLLLADKRVDPGSFRNYAIRWASGYGHAEVVRSLLTDPRVDPSDCNNYAIRWASSSGRAEVVRVLLSDPRVDPTTYSNSCITLASRHGHLEVVRQLLTDPRVDPYDDNGIAIKWCLERKHIEMILLFKERKETCKMSLNVQFSISSSWSSGGQGTLSIKNIGTSPVNNWKVGFIPTNFSLTSVSDFSLKGGQTNNTTEISAPSWSSSKSINPGAVVSSPFNYSGSSSQLKLIDTDPISQFSGVESSISISSNSPSTQTSQEPSTSQTAPISVPISAPISAPNSVPLETSSRTAFLQNLGGKRSIVYYPNYAIYGRKYYPADVDGSLVTDIIISFLCPNPSEADYKILKDNWQFPIPEQVYQTHKPPIKPELHLVSHDEWADFGMTLPGSSKKGVIPAFVELKKKYPHLKIHLADGGWSLSWNFSKMADPVLRKNHIDGIVSMLLEHNLDGLNLDWEFPGKQGIGYNYINYMGVPDEQTQTLFVKELRKALNLASPNKHLELSVTYGADPLVIKQHKDIINDVDWLGIMSYDFTGSWTNDTSFHSGVYIDPNDKSLPQGFCGADSVANSLALGIDPSKVIYGIPTYGRGWKATASTTIFGKGLGPASSLDPAEYAEDGNTSWRAINSEIRSGRFQDFNSETTLAAWGRDSKNQLWTYDNPKTVTQKVDFSLSQGLGGILFWDIVSDVKDLKSPDSLIGTATRRLISNKDIFISRFEKGNVTQNVPLPYDKVFVPPGGSSPVTGTITVPPGGSSPDTGNTVPPGGSSPDTGNTVPPGGSSPDATGLKVVSVTLLNDSNKPVTIEPNKSIFLSFGYLS